MEKLIHIKSYTSRPEANLARGLLESNGIKAMVSADDEGGMGPDLLWSTGGAKLKVRDEDKEEALRLLEG